SQGMRRRLELYRAFLHGPRILLLDEPTAGLDTKQSAQFFAYIKRYIQENEAIIIFSTHRPRELEHCHQVVMMNRGRVIASGEPAQFLGLQTKLNANFLVSAGTFGDQL